MSLEQEYWRSIIQDLRAKHGPNMTVAAIAEAIGVEDRQVHRWIEGDRPKGFTAVRLYLLHVRVCPPGRCPPGHSQVSAKAQSSAAT